MQLAKSIFSSFGKSELLIVNSGDLVSNEIYNNQSPHEAYDELPDRDHTHQITQHIRETLITKA